MLSLSRRVAASLLATSAFMMVAGSAQASIESAPIPAADVVAAPQHYSLGEGDWP